MFHRHKWSIASIGLTVVVYAVTGIVTQYEYRVNGIRAFAWVPPLGGGTFIAALALGITAFIKERRSLASIIALVVSFANILFYTA